MSVATWSFLERPVCSLPVRVVGEQDEISKERE